MTNEDQNNQAEVMNEDNLLAELEQFNSGSLPEVEEPQTQEEPVKEQATEEVQETESDEKLDKEPETKSEIEQWLIENKFKNDEEGVQSKSDKEKNEWNSEKEKFDKLAQLDDYLAQNPDVVQKLTKSVQEKQQDLNSPPVKPEDYDILDESIDNSSSAQWRKQHDEWLSESQAFDAETIELQKMGLSDTEIVEYRQFIADPNNVTQENLVKIWQTLSNGYNSKPEVNVENTPKVKNKQNSAASVSGSAPAVVEPEEKALDNFWKGIMEFNNNT